MAPFLPPPPQEVRRLASALVDKWRASFDAELFAELPYDAAAAAEAPEGDAAGGWVVRGSNLLAVDPTSPRTHGLACVHTLNAQACHVQVGFQASA